MYLQQRENDKFSFSTFPQMGCNCAFRIFWLPYLLSMYPYSVSELTFAHTGFTNIFFLTGWTNDDVYHAGLNNAYEHMVHWKKKPV